MASSKGLFGCGVVIVVVGGSAMFLCCGGFGLLGFFANQSLEHSRSELKRAGTIYDDGNKAEAVEIYKEHVHLAKSQDEGRIYERIIGYELSKGEKQEAEKWAIDALEHSVTIETEDVELSQLFARVEEARKQRDEQRNKANDPATAVDSSSVAEVPADVSYEIVDADRIPGIKCGLDIRISRRVREDVLHAIALRIRDQEKGDTYDRMFIGYYLPGMKVGGGAWATTHFNPELEVRVLGWSAEQVETVLNTPFLSSQAPIGRWVDDATMGMMYSLYRERGRTYLARKFNDGSGTVEEMRVRNVSGQRRYEHKKAAYDHYVIGKRGELQIWDKEGLVESLAPWPITRKRSKTSSNENTKIEGIRIWTDNTGKHEIEAQFVRVKDGKVEMKKRDGRIITVPLEKLSDADRQHAIGEQQAHEPE